jgi:hypothetical protein
MLCKATYNYTKRNFASFYVQAKELLWGSSWIWGPSLGPKSQGGPQILAKSWESCALPYT